MAHISIDVRRHQAVRKKLTWITGDTILWAAFESFASLTHHKPQIRKSIEPVFLAADYHLLCSNEMGVVASTISWCAGIKTWMEKVYNCVPTFSLNSDCHFNSFSSPFFSLPPDFANKPSRKTASLSYMSHFFRSQWHIRVCLDYTFLEGINRCGS